MQKYCYTILILWYAFSFWNVWALTGEDDALDSQQSVNWSYDFKELCYNHKLLTDFLKSQISECSGAYVYYCFG